MDKRKSSHQQQLDRHRARDDRGMKGVRLVKDAAPMKPKRKSRWSLTKGSKGSNKHGKAKSRASNDKKKRHLKSADKHTKSRYHEARHRQQQQQQSATGHSQPKPLMKASAGKYRQAPPSQRNSAPRKPMPPAQPQISEHTTFTMTPESSLGMVYMDDPPISAMPTAHTNAANGSSFGGHGDQFGQKGTGQGPTPSSSYLSESVWLQTSTVPTSGTNFEPVQMLPPKPVTQHQLSLSNTPTLSKTSHRPNKEDQTVKENLTLNSREFHDEQRQTEKLRRFVEQAAKLGLDGMEKVFRSIADHLPQVSTRIDFDEHPEKNRFQDMVCVDQTRVFLDRGPGNDYIHASWVPLGPRRKCIVTQLPLAATAMDFWEMCLQQNVQNIVLFLTPFEFDKFTGRAFLPEQGDFIHYPNHVRVGCVKVVEVSSNWSLHLLTIKHKDRQKYLHLNHYKDWKHGNRPGDIDEIWRLESMLRVYKSPQVYMSLSGGGRAGTFVAMQLAHYYMHADADQLQVSKCVRKTRDSRMHAVQSVAQYQFIYMALLKHILDIQNVDKLISEKNCEKARQLLIKYGLRPANANTED